MNGLVQIIVDNFDASLSSPNGLVSTHDMATIETNYTPPTEEGPGTIPRISKTEMSSPICNEEEDEIIPYVGSEKPLPPEARAFILACNNMRNCASLNAAKVQVWKNNMKQNFIEPPKLC